ncbi:hypothetical protein Forpe1208_v014400 [Fusarium oxysporum f. sp. rapae]|uniref:Xaa-Pro dipeptidyl-peptidase-like domain-containing protein n=1 Tax=Fusarium oxysporum f. sp. rapae TaxID=485398 RepID=A0A8J5TP52_FUSOX|nr:hypothetical protein Forpe1208_v014400 [Fusarium oxysporum f. sp. rapae]
MAQYYLFEAADPVGGSERKKGYYSKEVGLDGYDIVEWLASQTWGNGRLALYGASGYAIAIIPVNGMADMYREMASKGGVSEKQFSECYPIFWNWSNNLVEDSLYGTRKHPYFDDYWRSKIPALNKIECPTYIICSWDDHGIHTRGALNAWREISSKEKYLEIHQDQK